MAAGRSDIRIPLHGQLTATSPDCQSEDADQRTALAGSLWFRQAREVVPL